MAEDELKKIINMIKQDYFWLAGFGLSDQQYYDINVLIVRATIGSDEFKLFYPKLKALLSGKLDEAAIKIIASNIFKYCFIPQEADIGELSGWIKIWGLSVSGEAPTEAKTAPVSTTINQDDDDEKESVEVEMEQELTLDQKLSKYDWSKIVGIERRAVLEELGVSLKDFVKWLDERKGKV